MVQKTSEFVRGRVLEMYHFLKSCRKVSKNLAKKEISVCSATVYNIINAEEKKARKKSSSKKQSKNPGTPLVRKKRLVIPARKVRSSFIWMGHVRTFIPTLSSGWKQTRLYTFLQDSDQPTPQICPQWIMELMEFLKIYVIVELQGLKTNWSKLRRKCGPK